MLNSSATISIVRGFNQLKPWIGFGWRSLGRWGWGGSGIAQDHPHYNNFWVGPQSHSEMPGEAIAQSSQALVQCVGCYKVNEQEPDNGPSQVLSTNAITNVIPTKTGISQWISLMFHHFWREISSPFHWKIRSLLVEIHYWGPTRCRCRKVDVFASRNPGFDISGDWHGKMETKTIYMWNTC